MPEPQDTSPQQSEGNFGQRLQGALQSAGESAINRLSAANQSPPAPASQTPPAGQGAEPPGGQAPPAQTPPTSQEPFMKFNRRGREYGLSQEDVETLLHFAADSYEEAALKAQQMPPEEQVEPVPKPASAPPAGPENELVKEMRDLKKQTQELMKARESDRREAETKEALSAVEQLFQQNKTFKEISDDEDKKLAVEETNLLKSFVLFAKGAGAGELDTVAKKISGMIERRAEKKAQKIIESKIKQGGTRVEGHGGGVPVPGPKQLTGRDFLAGKVREAAYERAAKALIGS